MSDKFSKNRITLTVEVETQFGPVNAVELIERLLTCPAVTKISFITVMSNHKDGKENSEQLRLVPDHIYLKK